MTSDQASQEIEERLRQAIGLDIRSVGSSMVSLAVRTRMKKRGLRLVEEYAGVLAGSEAELQALVEEIVVPETWFFRDHQPFFALGEWALREWLPSHPFDVLRILSVPCSTGEEPFSIVMALLDAGLPPERFAVEAVDISEIALETARRGLYSRNAFRGLHLEYRDKYFAKTAKGWQLDEFVRRQVQFRHANVLDAAFARRESQLDVIFCRNLMIYFDEASRSRWMTQLHEMLVDQGRLFLGHAEGGIARSFGFEPLPLSMAFAFRKIEVHAAAPVRPLPKMPPLAPKTAIPLWQTVLSVPAVPPPRRAKAKPPQVPAVVVPASADTLLAQAKQLADAGRFEEARTQCEASLQAHGPCADTYYLLGLINDAAGNAAEAEAFYRKTLYLEPDHYETLFQLALLTKKGGNARAARQLQERARRAQSKSTAKTTAS